MSPFHNAHWINKSSFKQERLLTRQKDNQTLCASWWKKMYHYQDSCQKEREPHFGWASASSCQLKKTNKNPTKKQKNGQMDRLIVTYKNLNHEKLYRSNNTGLQWEEKEEI